MKTATMVWTTFQVVGFHSWPAAPVEVGYLSLQHRHIFKFKVGIEVVALDRQIEFHTLNAYAKAFVDANYGNTLGLVDKTALNFMSNSCEMLAKELAMYLSVMYTNTTISVEVSEDGEHGAIVDLVSPEVTE